MAKEFVKQGGCAFSTYQEILVQEWKNQKQENTRYFYMFPTSHKTVAGWNILSTSPYLDIFASKFNHLEQAGVMEMLYRQYLTFRTMETEVLMIQFLIF